MQNKQRRIQGGSAIWQISIEQWAPEVLSE